MVVDGEVEEEASTWEAGGSIVPCMANLSVEILPSWQSRGGTSEQTSPGLLSGGEAARKLVAEAESWSCQGYVAKTDNNTADSLVLLLRTTVREKCTRARLVWHGKCRDSREGARVEQLMAGDLSLGVGAALIKHKSRRHRHPQ